MFCSGEALTGENNADQDSKGNYCPLSGAWHHEPMHVSKGVWRGMTP